MPATFARNVWWRNADSAVSLLPVRSTESMSTGSVGIGIVGVTSASSFWSSNVRRIPYHIADPSARPAKTAPAVPAN
jgi:hypothetical protein